MQLIRRGFAAVLTVGLLGVPMLAVAASDAVDGQSLTPIFGWEVTDVLEGGALVIHADDPRASGVMTHADPAVHADHDTDEVALRFGHDTAQLTNDGGAWVGGWTHLSLDAAADPAQRQALDVWQLTGAEGYEGLGLRLVEEGRQGSDGFRWGVVFPISGARPSAATEAAEPVVFTWSATTSGAEAETIVASDPRAGGSLTISRGEPLVADALSIVPVAIRLVNDGGAWTGTGRSVNGGVGQGVAGWQLTGEGGYAGLSLLLFHDEAATTESWGILLPTEAIPSDPPLPPR